MQAAVLHALGQVPRCDTFPDPVANDGEVLVSVHAAALKPVDKQLASGAHYASARPFPAVCGTDGVGHLEDGTRVFFGGARAPYGAMAELTVVPRPFTFPVPEGVSDEIAAALPNPGVSGWLALAFRARLQTGENVLILGATGISGRLTIRIAKILGAGRVVAAGRDPQMLKTLPALGADATIALNAPDLGEAIAHEAGDSGFQVVVDYVWGRPAEAFLASATSRKFTALRTEIRYVQVGESAGPIISLPAAVLRSTAITMMGTAGIPPGPVLADALQKVLAHAARGDLHVDTEPVPLARVESAWRSEPSGRRLVIIP
jgi:NADPH:quinone reductase-like Zn-dependent oxidoreductase